ncbi:MAG: hypothetical protein IJO13_06060 [Lachnospiraceae bacterium]|nr:hypothetical protein [Lachnospiraceae bacterium]
MKKYLIFVGLLLCLAGCGKTDTAETAKAAKTEQTSVTEMAEVEDSENTADTSDAVDEEVSEPFNHITLDNGAEISIPFSVGKLKEYGFTVDFGNSDWERLVSPGNERDVHFKYGDLDILSKVSLCKDSDVTDPIPVSDPRCDITEITIGLPYDNVIPESTVSFYGGINLSSEIAFLKENLILVNELDGWSEFAVYNSPYENVEMLQVDCNDGVITGIRLNNCTDEYRLDGYMLIDR